MKYKLSISKNEQHLLQTNELNKQKKVHFIKFVLNISLILKYLFYFILFH